MSAQWSPRRLEYGAAITVVHRPHVTYLIFAHFVMKGGKRSKRAYAERHGFDDLRINLDEEGLMWARGHSGPAVDALRVSVALASAPVG